MEPVSMNQSLLLSFLKQNYDTLVISLVALLLVIILRRIFNLKLRLPPGPTKWPLFGSLLLLGKLPHQAMMKLSRQYGPIMFMKLGSLNGLVISSPEMAREILKTQDQIFSSRPITSVGEIFAHGSQDIAFAPNGPAWRLLRKVCTVELFSPKRIAQFQNVRHEETLAAVRYILKSGMGNTPVQIDEKLAEMATNNITRMIFNKRFFGDNMSDVISLGETAEFQTLVRACFKEAGALMLGDFIPALKPLDVGGSMGSLWRFRGRFEVFFLSIIEEHRQKMKANSDSSLNDFLDVLLSFQDNSDGNQLTTTQIIAVLQDMLLAGTETAAVQITWTLSELMRHPETLRKAQEELDTLIGQNRLVEESDLPQLKYLKAVVKESFRLHPPGPLLIPHASVAATKVAGYDIPDKTIVYVNVYAIGRDPQVWENASVFNPERFMGNSMDVKGQDFELLPFGSGRRICPGINLGLLMVEFGLARLLHTLDFSLPQGMNPADVSMDELFGLSIPRAHPLEVVVSPRLACWPELQTAE